MLVTSKMLGAAKLIGTKALAAKLSIGAGAGAIALTSGLVFNYDGSQQVTDEVGNVWSAPVATIAGTSATAGGDSPTIQTIPRNDDKSYEQ